MAGSMRGSSMRGGRTRRSMSEINVVPYIDVMLVLLIIFMVAAPMVAPGEIELPSVGKSANAPTTPIEVIIRANKTVEVNVRAGNAPSQQRVAIADVGTSVLAAQREHSSDDAPTPVVIAADKTVPYDTVLQVMDSLQKQNVKRIGLSVKPAPQ